MSLPVSVRVSIGARIVLPYRTSFKFNGVLKDTTGVKVLKNPDKSLEIGQDDLLT